MNRKTPKRIVFNISEEDHMTIKKLALQNKMTMRTWIVNAMALAIKIQHPELLKEKDEQYNSL